MLPARSYPWTQVWTQTHKHLLVQTIPNKQRRSQSLVRPNYLDQPTSDRTISAMGILGIVTMPLGLDVEFWRQMGYGIEWMNAVGLGSR